MDYRYSFSSSPTPTRKTQHRNENGRRALPNNQGETVQEAKDISEETPTIIHFSKLTNSETLHMTTPL